MSSGNNKSRYLYIDNLRLFMIVLVVMMHYAVTYSGLGSWYFMDTTKLDIASNVFFGIYQSYTQAYFMGFLFLISGCFVARSYDKKGIHKFIKDRFIRLGIPAFIYMLVIQPFNVYVLLGSTWDRPEFFTYYSKYLLSFDFLGCSGPLWFAVALLLFDCIYAAFRRLTRNRLIPKEQKLPDTGYLLLIIVLITIFTYLVRLVQPIGTNLLNMQLCFFSQYIILFSVGIRAGRYDWFSQINYKTGRNWLLAAFIPGILYWIIILLAGGYLANGFDIYQGGLNWQSAAYALWEAFTCVAMSVGLIGLFQEKLNKQNKLIKILSDNSFAVYMFHAPIIIAVSITMVKLQLQPVLKFLLACMIGIPLSFLFSHYILRRIPLLKKIL